MVQLYQHNTEYLKSTRTRKGIPELHLLISKTIPDRVGENFESNWTRGGKALGDQVKREIEFSPFPAVTKYGRRGPNLAVFFLRQGMASNDNKQSGNEGYSGGELGSSN